MSSSKSLQEMTNEQLIYKLLLMAHRRERYRHGPAPLRIPAIRHQDELCEEVLRRMAPTLVLPNNSQCSVILKIAKNCPCGAAIPTDDIEAEITLEEFLQDMRTQLDKFEKEASNAK